MENNQLQRSQNTPQFMVDATSTLEKMQSYAKLLADSELLPKHFYRLDQYKKPLKDTNGKLVPNVPAVILAIQHGLEVGMSVSQALQQVIPINGVTSIKGDGAMALIQNSGLCVSWKEEITGSIEKEDYTVKITAKHKNGREKTVDFSVNDAKRLGLWVTAEMVQKNDALRHGGWWKVPKRMIAYRALGFMARDLFPEVMQGMYTEEEARDLNEDNTVMQTTEGMTVKITDNTKGAAMNAAAEELLTGAPSTPQTTTTTSSTKPRTPKKTAAPQPEAPKVEPVIEDVEFEEVPQTPSLKPLDEVREMAPQALFAYMQEVIGFDMQSRLFDNNPEKKTKRILIELYTALLAGQQETYIKANFEIEQEPSKPISEPAIESGMEWPPLGADGKRSIGDAFTVFDAFEAKGIKEEDILDALSTNGVEFSSVEDFYKRADSSILNLIYNA